MSAVDEPTAWCYCQGHRIDVKLLYVLNCASACLQLSGG